MILGMRLKGALVVVLATVATVLGAFSASAQAAVQCPPEVAIEHPLARSPSIRSFHGTASGTEPVVVRIYRGEHAEGKLEATLEAPVSEGEWATPNMAVSLPEGTHTVLATEGCEGGEEGKSEAVTFALGYGGPWVTMESVPVRSADATPAFRGTTTEENTPVVVNVYAGTSAERTAVARLEAEPHDGIWSTAPLGHPLVPGVYTAVATQSSIYESQKGESEAESFLVEPTEPKPGSGRAPIQALLETDGQGKLYDDQGASSWWACPKGAECDPFGTGQDISTGTSVSGTVFLASDPLTQEIAVSPTWEGNIELATPPSVSGEIAANTLVKAVSATWSGGWQGDFDQLTLAACETPTGNDCTTLTDWEFDGTCQSGSAVIDPAFAGYYLAVTDHVYGPGTAFAGVGHPSPYHSTALESGPTVATSVVGRIAPATGPSEATCGVESLQPTVTLDVVPTPSEDQTPSFSGTTSYASTRPVIVQVFAGSKPEGTPVATVEAQPEAAKWQSASLAEPLSHGIYTAMASEQSSFGKAEGKSSPVTFQVQESVQEYLENREEAEPLFTITGTAPDAIIPPPSDSQFEKEFWERIEREKREHEQAGQKAPSGAVAGSKAKSRPPNFYVLKHPKKEHCKPHYVRTHKYGIKQYLHGHWVTGHPTVCLHVAPKSRSS